jgi:ribosomal protein S27E
MTKEEAIKQLKIELSKWESDCKSYHKTKDALDMGIKALQDKSYELWKESYVVEHQRNIRLEEKIKELEQEPCEDVVSRQAVLDAVRKNTFRLTFAEEQGCEGHIAWSAEAVYSDVIEGALLELPAVKPKQRKGKWENKNTNGHYFYGKCSECGQEFCVDTWYTQNMKYCPNCGAEMESEE